MDKISSFIKAQIISEREGKQPQDKNTIQQNIITAVKNKFPLTNEEIEVWQDLISEMVDNFYQ